MEPESALTRCPECQTVFTVDGEDLARAGGRVRCGDCLGVFDAIANALPAEAQPEVETASEGIVEPAAHTETATSLTWTLLEPVEAPPGDATESEASEFTPEQLPADDTGSSSTDGSQVNDRHDEDASVQVSEFRFGDDTPPEMLEAELDALLGDERGESKPPTPPEEPDFDLTSTMSDVGDADLFDNDWDDLLNELDESAASVALTLIDDESAEAPPLDFELADSDTSTFPSSVDLDLSRADAALAAPESIDSITLEAGTDYREVPRFPTSEATQDESHATPDEVDSSSETPAETPTSVPENVGEVSEPIDDESFPVPQKEDDGVTTDEEFTQAADTTPVDPAVANADVEARLAAYHAALEASSNATPSSPEPNDADDAAFDQNALTDMFSAADILAGGEAAAAADDERAAELPDDTDPAQVNEASVGTPQDDTDATESAISTDQASAESEAGDTGDAVLESSQDHDQTDGYSGDNEVDALAAAMANEEQGEVIVLSGDPSELEEPADAFAESMILSPDLAPRPPKTRLWLSLSAAAILALGIQGVHGYRGVIATMQPWGGYLSGAYALFGQTITPRWNATQMCVERSGGALGADNQLDIETVFSNHGDKTMPMPILKLRITDAYSDTLAGVVIQPQDYLPATDPRIELRPGEQATALATLDYSEPRLDGFEVSLCYPGDDNTLRCAVRCEDDNENR